jgi:SagB-type dehydrogenase family enzyme
MLDLHTINPKRFPERTMSLYSLVFQRKPYGHILPLLVLFLLESAVHPPNARAEDMNLTTKPAIIELPRPHFDSGTSLESALLERRSVRFYTGRGLTLKEVSQLLWAGQGITSPRGFRTAPSAGALYPLELHLVAGRVADLSSGAYRYNPGQHTLLERIIGDLQEELHAAALLQGPVAEAPVLIIICAVYERVTGKYGQRGIRYTHMESGHAAQNICLQAVSLGLKPVTIGAFRDREIQSILQLKKSEHPLYIIPVGK